MNLKNNYNFVIYSILYISLLFGLFINEDLATGYKADHFTHLYFIEKFEQNFVESLLNFNRKDLEFSTSHSPFFYTFYLLIKNELNKELHFDINNLKVSKIRDILKKLGLTDYIIPEPLGGAHRDLKTTMNNVKYALKKELSKLKKESINFI